MVWRHDVGGGRILTFNATAIVGDMWTGVAAAITVMNGVNAFGKKGVASMEIETEEDGPAGGARQAPAAAPDARERLEQLKELEAAGLITQEEYEEKREEILREL